MIAGQEQAGVAARKADRLLGAEQAFEAAMDLWSLCPELLHAPTDSVRAREVEQTRSAWGRLKERLGTGARFGKASRRGPTSRSRRLGAFALTGARISESRRELGGRGVSCSALTEGASYGESQRHEARETTMDPIHKHTRLSELRALCAARGSADETERLVVPTRMLASVEQSMRVEGYTLVPEVLIRETLRALEALRR